MHQLFEKVDMLSRLIVELELILKSLVSLMIAVMLEFSEEQFDKLDF